MKKALFPLPLVLFPGGITRLRIFEPRYLRMVKETAGDTGFVLCAPDGSRENGLSEFGCWVKIINFETLEGNMLGIDIQAEVVTRIELDHIEDDQLAIGEVQVMPHWPDNVMDDDTVALSVKLQKLFVANDELRQLYPEPVFEDANWVCARLLECLPMLAHQKTLFFKQNSFEQVLVLLKNLVLANKVQ